jgi:zinc protease
MSLGRFPLPSVLTLLLFVLVGIPAFATQSGTSAARYPELGPVTHRTLANGMQVLIAPSSSSDLETIDVWVGAGSRRETAANNGVAHFFEHLLFKGTPTKQPGEIDAAIEDLGGSMDAATSYDWAHFYVTVGSSDAEAALDVLADAIRNSELRQHDMDDERSVILDEIARDDASPTELLKQQVDQIVFGDHPYGRPIIGTEDNVTNMKRQTVLDFYRTYYVPSNVTLVMAGKVAPDDGMAMAQKAFGAWAVKPLPADKLLPVDRMHDINVQNQSGDVSSGYLVMGFNAPSVKDIPDAYVMDVLLTLLGQGGNDRLEEDLLRKQKIVKSITADYLTQRDPGVMTITASFDPQNLNHVVSSILSEVETLRDSPVSDSDLAAAKHSLLANYLFDVQTDNGRAGALGFYNTIDSYQYDTGYIDNFESVTAQQVQAVAVKYLNPHAYALVTLTPKVDPQTASLPRSY